MPRLAATLALAFALALAASANAERPPNIIVILADDLGYGDVSCFNPESKVRTPHIDRLAAGGMRFTDAHSPSTVCTPTRYSLLTGRMAFRNGMKGVFDGAGGPCLIEAERPTLPGMLRDNGYATACFGKWHIGLTFQDQDGKPVCQNGFAAAQRVDFSKPILDGPIHRGFDEFYGTACCPTTDWIYAFIDGDRVPVPPTGIIDKEALGLPSHPYSRDCRPGLHAPNFNMEEVDLTFLEKSLAFIDRQARQHPDQPFFLFHSAQRVHLPSFPADRFKGKSGAESARRFPPPARPRRRRVDGGARPARHRR
ncbi:MAG: sulfatase-like hydrolase/transferase [Verrucomicrobiales bacterium]